MADQDLAVESVRKITEKSEKARREFFKKVEKIVKSTTSSKLMQAAAEKAALEYLKLFGRLGVHPLLHLKDGKKLPRYILDRDEYWMIYKPPLWQMGGSEENWMRKVKELADASPDLYTAFQTLLATDKAEVLQEWHGLIQGKRWLDGRIKQWGFVQRLDLETDGPVIVCKTWRAYRVVQVQMKEHVVSKAYMCLVHGRVDNRIQFVRARFAELGQDGNSQVMLKHDSDNDPFFDWSNSGRLQGRQVKMAQTFFKPIAYYRRKEDGSEYTLMYVNILSGITHQIRITMQSVGHPLVADDRYLPKEQAVADLAWCPRNFLSEVRSDWFDLCGNFKDAPRRRYTRISVENPLPRMFQDILERKLTLIEKLDPSADLGVGCQYWAIGDEQLMNAHPKDDEYRRKVMRWGQRHRIHLDALDRLLLLPKEEIDEVLNNYRPFHDKEEASWICPKCMSLHLPRRGENLEKCFGLHGQDCEGMRVTDEDKLEPPPGWMNYLADPTIHLIFLINEKWLEARKKIVRTTRPAWEKPPMEVDGTEPTEDILASLEAALILNAKSGGNGIHESELRAVPGMQDIELPLAPPPEGSSVQRVRLPGCGTRSQWMYTLKGKERVKHTAEYSIKTSQILAPLVVKTDPIPTKQVITTTDKLKRERMKERDEEERKKEEAEGNDSNLELKAEFSGQMSSWADDEPAAKKPKTKCLWKRLESSRRPGTFYYFDPDSGETREDTPPDFEESQPAWERFPSKSVPGECYYYNHETGESRGDRPLGVEIRNDEVKREVEVDAKTVPWERKESSSKPGTFYYFHPITGTNEVNPPEVDLPWVLLESGSRKGQYYYHNEMTSETTVDPPAGARPAKGPPPSSSRTAPPTEPSGPVQAPVDSLRPNWQRMESDKFKGKYYYVNAVTGETTWDRPAGNGIAQAAGGNRRLPPNWEQRESDKHKGKFYYVNAVTGETKWDRPDEASKKE